MDSSGPQRVTVAVPLYRPQPTPDEWISWRHLQHFLGHLDLRLFLPEDLPNPFPEIPAERFPAGYFDSVASYSRLLLSEDFYRRFETSEFLLIYQLDALVFSQDLESWCDAGYDYLGAPWWRDPERPDLGLSRTGNGGLSLRRVSAFLSVLTSTHKPSRPLFRGPKVPDLAELPALQRWRRQRRVLGEALRGVGWYTANYSLNEDRFWADRARLFDPRFRIAPPREALGFSFEVAPRRCFQLNGSRLPFGCHGWARYDREFWQPYLLQEGESGAS